MGNFSTEKRRITLDIWLASPTCLSGRRPLRSVASNRQSVSQDCQAISCRPPSFPGCRSTAKCNDLPQHVTPAAYCRPLKTRPFLELFPDSFLDSNPSPVNLAVGLVIGGAENAGVENVAPKSTDGKLAMRYLLHCFTRETWSSSRVFFLDAPLIESD